MKGRLCGKGCEKDRAYHYCRVTADGRRKMDGGDDDKGGPRSTHGPNRQLVDNDSTTRNSLHPRPSFPRMLTTRAPGELSSQRAQADKPSSQASNLLRPGPGSGPGTLALVADLIPNGIKVQYLLPCQRLEYRLELGGLWSGLVCSPEGGLMHYCWRAVVSN
jgi:hypothetical protein